jgi:hypothetical protein
MRHRTVHAGAEIASTLPLDRPSGGAEARVMVRRDRDDKGDAAQRADAPEQAVQQGAREVQRRAVADLARQPPLADAEPGDAGEDDHHG